MVGGMSVAASSRKPTADRGGRRAWHGSVYRMALDNPRVGWLTHLNASDYIPLVTHVGPSLVDGWAVVGVWWWVVVVIGGGG